MISKFPKDKYKRPIKDLRISVTDRCNFRCNYCMPAEIFGESYKFLPKPELLSFEEIERMAKIFAKLGVNKIRITGGEPLVRRNIESLIQALSSINGIDDLTMTTYGFLLSKDARSLKKAGLNRLTVSLDSLDEKIFNEMSGVSHGPKKTIDGITSAIREGFENIKVNVVVRKGVNDHTILDTLDYFIDKNIIVRFIEFMDVGTKNKWQMDEVVTSQEILDIVRSKYDAKPISPNYKGEVASRYKIHDYDNEIGIISSVTNPFCGACSRARLSTDGKLITCLFASGGKDLRNLLRSGASDSEISAEITKVWNLREDRYSELRSKSGDRKDKVEMYYIGG